MTLPKKPLLIKVSPPRPLVTPGMYEAKIVSARVGFDRLYKRWVADVGFDLLNYDGPRIGPVVLHLNLGKGSAPEASARSNFYEAWAVITGAPPTCLLLDEEALAAAFVGRIVRVEIETVLLDRKQQPRPLATQYSKIVRVVEAVHVHAHAHAHAHPTNQPISHKKLHMTSANDQHNPAAAAAKNPDSVSRTTTQSTDAKGESTAEEVADSPTQGDRRSLPSCPSCNSFSLYREENGRLICQTCGLPQQWG
jgi:hypothetical protein